MRVVSTLQDPVVNSVVTSCPSEIHATHLVQLRCAAYNQTNPPAETNIPDSWVSVDCKGGSRASGRSGMNEPSFNVSTYNCGPHPHSSAYGS